MRSLTTALAILAILVCGISYGQERTSNYEHLKCYDQLIGTWTYDGPALETLPEILNKGDHVVVRVTYKWILDKGAVEVDYFSESKSGGKVTARGLIGWNRANGQIIEVGMNSWGGHSMATDTYDPATKTWRSVRKGVNSKGNATSSILVLTLQDKDTYVSQALGRKGGVTEGDGPKVVYKRVASPEPKPAEQGK